MVKILFFVTTLPHLILLCFILSLDDVTGQKTALLVKRVKSHRKEMIKLRTESFRELVINSDMIIDRSLLIKEILERPEKRVIISCPAKWSKTINLDMLKTFLKIETDDKGIRIRPVRKTFAYKLFNYGELFDDVQNESFHRPFLISRHQDFVDEYLGQYPVLYLRLNFINGLSDLETIESIKSILYQAYKPHMYLLEVLKEFHNNINEADDAKRNKAKEYYDSLKRIIRETESDEEALLNGLNLICKLLCRHHGKRVVVMIDDYDSSFYKFFYRKYFPDSDIKYVLKQIEKLLSPILAEDHKYIERVIMTATYRFTDIIGPIADSIPSYTLVNHPWLEYFAFNNHDVLELCQHLGKTNKDYHTLSSWYMGFKSSLNETINLGTPFTILSYLMTNVTALYSSRFPEFFYWFEMNKIRPFRQMLQSMVNDDVITIEINDLSFSKTEMQNFKEIATFESSQRRAMDEYGIARFSISYLCTAGYLTLFKPNATMNMAQVCIPNKEMLTLISRKMKIYYSKNYKLSYLIIDKVVGIIVRYMMNKMTNPMMDLKDRLDSLFDKLTFSNSTHPHLYTLQYYDDMMHELLSFLSIKLRNLAKLETKVFKEKNSSMSYLVSIKETHSLILGLQYNQTADNLLSAIKEKNTYLNKNRNLTCHKFVAVAYFTNGTITLMSDCDFTNHTGLM